MTYRDNASQDQDSDTTVDKMHGSLGPVAPEMLANRYHHHIYLPYLNTKHRN